MPATGWSDIWRGTGSTSARHRESGVPSVAAAASAADSRSGRRYTVRHPEPQRRRRIFECRELRIRRSFAPLRMTELSHISSQALSREDGEGSSTGVRHYNPRAMFKIVELFAREILDSRGNPTVE